MFRGQSCAKEIVRGIRNFKLPRRLKPLKGFRLPTVNYFEINRLPRASSVRCSRLRGRGRGGKSKGGGSKGRGERLQRRTRQEHRCAGVLGRGCCSRVAGRDVLAGVGRLDDRRRRDAVLFVVRHAFSVLIQTRLRKRTIFTDQVHPCRQSRAEFGLVQLWVSECYSTEKCRPTS